jgi:hypothetical protein
MPRSVAFRDLRSAPRDGSTIEVKHGPRQKVVHARWSGQGQAWVRVGDPLRQALHRVTGWAPLGRGRAPEDQWVLGYDPRRHQVRGMGTSRR